MVYPLVLQVAHPTVGAGVRDFSDFEQRPWDRLLRTVDYVSLLVYGGPAAAPAGRRLRDLHAHFQGIREDGARYSALEPEAYAWVHATLIETYIAGHARFGKPMRRDEIDRFYCEYRGLGRLIGVRERDLPDTWLEFCTYFDRVVTENLVRTEAVDRVLRSIGNAPAPPIPIPSLVWSAVRLPAARLLWLGGVGMMAPELRRRLRIDWSLLDEIQFRALSVASRSVTPVMPERLRVTGPAQLRWRAREIASGPLGAAA